MDSSFCFGDEHSLTLDSNYVARIRASIESNEALLEEYYEKLRLPAYFGFNWDALDECLRDLAWLNQRKVAIVHRDIPRLLESDRKIYLELLSNSVKHWKPGDSHELMVVFPREWRDVISMD